MTRRIPNLFGIEGYALPPQMRQYGAKAVRKEEDEEDFGRLLKEAESRLEEKGEGE